MRVLPKPSASKPQAATSGHPAAPQEPQAAVDSISETYTFFTTIPAPPTPLTQLLYTATRPWVTLTLLLETAGPVAVGTKSDLSPVLGGAGVLLPTGVPLQWTLARGNRFYIAATSINRVKVIIDPVSWLQQISNLVSGLFKR